MFREADVDGGGGLSIAQFRDAMKKVMGDVDDENLDIIFMKVDANCDGSVDWDEYLNYMLLEYRVKHSLQKKTRPLYFPKPLKILQTGHCEIIVSLQFHSFLPPVGEKKGDSGEQERFSGGMSGRTHGGRYISVSHDGILIFWSERFKIQRTIHIGQMPHTIGQPVWVSDMVCLSNINMLSISSTGRDVEFYDISANKCDIVFSLSELEANVIVMDYWTDGRKAIFCIGVTSGAIFIFISSDVVQNGLFDSTAFKTGCNYRIPVTALLKNTSSLFLCCRVPIHNDWVYQMRYIPELNCIATCCAANQAAMILTTLPHSFKCKVQTAHFHQKKGIQCFDYSPDLNILVTGGFDRVVRVWNPYLTNKATSHMKGHAAGITHIAVNGKDNQIISVSKDKNVRVWDLLDCTCVQNIHSRNVNLGRSSISRIYYNHTSNTMVLASCLVGVLQGAIDEVDSSQPKTVTSHEQPLCAALYNPNFKQVVSGCHAGVVSVWDIQTGEKVMQFQTIPERPAEITAMAFDEFKRRLITGSNNGTIRLWNFNNGALLSEISLVDDQEVTGIIYINERIYVSGWGKKVMWYLDAKEEDEIEYRVWNQYHSEDIYSMHAHSSKMLVTASYSGDIIVWNIDSGQAFCRFNASESPLPLIPIRVRDKARQGSVLRPNACVDESEKESEDEDEDDVWLRSISVFLKAMSQSVDPQVRQLTTETTPTSILEGRRGSIQIPVSACLPQAPLVREARMTRRGALAHKCKTKKPKINNMEELNKPCFAVEKALFLSTRERSPDTAVLLTSSADGYIYAWSVYLSGGLLAKFRARHKEGSIVTAMSTDSQNQILLSGHSNGYIMVWDIEKYCYRMWSEKSEEKPAKESTLRLPDLIPHYCRVQGPPRVVLGQEKEIHKGWTVSLMRPALLSSWRGHLKSIVHLEYVERFRLIVTASLDCNVRLWTIAGKYIGTFGQGMWCVGDPSAIPRELPADLKKAGSCQTLKVLNEGRYPHWNCAKRIVENLRAQKRHQSDITKFGEATTLTELVAADPRIVKYTDEQVENTWTMWQEKGKQTSSILGQAYKQKVRHHLPSCPPDLQTPHNSHEQLRVYNCMPYSSLLPIIQPPVPELLRDSHLRAQEGPETTKQKKPAKRRPHTRYMAVLPRPGLKRSQTSKPA
ncbi:WD repeat-containing protein on Y chromosome-like [Osmerus mordax]|uniref:WD repeat-containing protein on Y chromosome-like n=1 Tax=Osmerus mordax TaxID=8014 RepID=UPI0035100F1D